jgi:TonB family protein
MKALLVAFLAILITSQAFLQGQTAGRVDQDRPIYAPTPKYPLEARWRYVTGSGLYALHILPNGTVASVEVVTTTRTGVLDNAAIFALRQWRFHPTGADRTVKVPVDFTLSAR